LETVTPRQVDGIEGLRELIGEELGPTDWVEITQEDIDSFAGLSRDFQWIHTDPERATKESPFGTTVAHGNLTLSLIDGFRGQLISQEGVVLGINYGWDRVRFPAPVPVDSKVRARAEIQSVEELEGGWYHVVTRFTIERDGTDKPVCVADSVGRALVASQDEGAGTAPRPAT
jgi:acyl dehydratase